MVRSASRGLLRNRLTMRYLPFYRHYPFSSPVSIASADKRGCVDLELGISLYRCTFVRNPYVRVLSAYLDKVQRKAAHGGRAVSFPEFLRRLDRGALYRNAHWAPQASLLLLPVTEYDFIGRVESLERDLAAVLATLQGRPVERPPRSALGNRTGAGGRLARYYDDSLAIVRRPYAQDFALFGYEPAIDLQPA